MIKLAGEAVAKRSKDLQLAVWLVDAHARREGFAIVPAAFQFLHGLVAEFWDTLYPEIEDGDVEVRAAPLEWFGSKFEEVLRTLPVTSSGLSWIRYKESRAIGYEKDATSDEKRSLRQRLIDEEGKIPAEDFDAAVDATPKPYCENLHASLNDSLEALEALNDLCNEKFGEFAPSYVRLRTALEEVSRAVRSFIDKKGGPSVAAVQPAEAIEEAPAPARHARGAGNPGSSAGSRPRDPSGCRSSGRHRSRRSRRCRPAAGRYRALPAPAGRLQHRPVSDLARLSLGRNPL